MVNLRTPGHAGKFCDARRRGSGVAVRDEAFDGGVEQTRPHGGAALRLGPPHTLSVDFCHHCLPPTFRRLPAAQRTF